MASIPAHHGVDIEAQRPQQVPLQPPEVGETEMYEMPLHQSHTNNDAGLAFSSFIGQAHGESEVPEMDLPQSEQDDAARHTPTQVGQGQNHAEAQTHNPGASVNDLSDQEPEEERMIGDFEGSSNPLWNLYGKEAKSYDEAHNQTLKDDMDGVLIFAGLFSAVLTSFIIDSKQNLQANPSDQMVYYIQQNVAILAQISYQISFLAPQVSVPSMPPPPFPTFNPSASDILINGFWFMALIFSLSAALLAILVQQWVRDYMHVFLRYNDPLKSARLRQYLQEGSEGWYMPVMAEAVPGLLHVSLFLFFVGLCDSVLNINITVGLSTTVPIGISGLLYIFTTFAPVLDPQSPYQNSFSGLIWYLIQKLYGRRYKDRDGKSKSVSTNMVQGRMQLAMEATEERKERDVRAILWLWDSLTQDTEIESFILAIPGSFDEVWGVEVWKRAFQIIATEPVLGMNGVTDMPPIRARAIRSVFGSIIRLVRPGTARDPQVPYPTIPRPYLPPIRKDVILDLGRHTARVLETCKNRSAFATDKLWRRRSRAGVETAAFLVCYADSTFHWSGDIVEVLANIGDFEETRESLFEGRDHSFVMRWTCLSLVTIGQILEDDRWVRDCARNAATLLKEEDDTHHPSYPTSVQGIDKALERAWTYLRDIFLALTSEANPTEKQVQQVLNNHDPQIHELEHINFLADDLKEVDRQIRCLQSWIDGVTYGIITNQLSGVEFDSTMPNNLGQTVEWSRDSLRFIYPGQSLKNLSSLVPTFRNIQDGQWDADVFQETLKDLPASTFSPRWQKNLLQRQLWRLQDLLDGGGLGFTVELFFLALRDLLLTSSPNQSTLYISTFRAITSNWNKYQDSLGTQKVLLYMVVSDDGIISGFEYPTYITDELLALLGNLLNGETGQHISDAVEQLTRQCRSEYHTENRAWWSKALRVLARTQALSPSPIWCAAFVAV